MADTPRTLRDHQRALRLQLALDAFARCESVSAAARDLGVSRRTLLRLLHQALQAGDKNAQLTPPPPPREH